MTCQVNKIFKQTHVILNSTLVQNGMKLRIHSQANVSCPYGRILYITLSQNIKRMKCAMKFYFFKLLTTVIYKTKITSKAFFLIKYFQKSDSLSRAIASHFYLITCHLFKRMRQRTHMQYCQGYWKSWQGFLEHDWEHWQ